MTSLRNTFSKDIPVDHEPSEQYKSKDASFLVPPQEEKSNDSSIKPPSGQSWMVPPQEEKVDTSGVRGEMSRLDKAINNLEGQINKHYIERDEQKTLDSIARSQQERDSVLSGAAGVTGEDVGVEEKSRVL
ncbi:hypothetical protein C8Q79DRAFT_1118091 [Trametes meyenii]|nr:hypothetical protein C8Q79DRAFT_1118091 [Trametes meyenii]